jgi:biotin synthase
MIARAKKAGLSICCGGIIGMGETWEDRIDMGLTIAETGADSVPINALMPIPGTPFGELPVLSEDDILRSIALFRFLNPTAGIRVAAGRILMKEGGRRAFLSGANAALTGEMLTTAGNDMDQDLAMFHSMGFELRA